MIEAIEVLLRHWGDQLAKHGHGGGLPSTMGTIVEYAGCAPRGGVYGARLLVAGAGPDYVAAEVAQVLFAIEGAQGGERLGRLARLRYRRDPILTVAEQVDVLELGRGDAGRRAYFRLLDQLHARVEQGLQVRQGKLATMRKESRRAGERTRKSAITQAAAAHRGRGREFEEAQAGHGAIAAHKAAKRAQADDRSSGDSASVGVVAASVGVGGNNP